MTWDQFVASASEPSPPAGLTPGLEALWWDRRGDWHAAHRCVQDEDGADSAWVHAYLHRKEGDLGNASYWYRRAGRPMKAGPLEGEWRALAKMLLCGTTG